MKKITITFANDENILVESGILAEDALKNHIATDKKVLAAKINNEICSLTTQIDINATIEPIYLGTKEGSTIYRRSLCFLLAAAARKCFSENRLLIGHSLGYGFYYTVEKDTALTQKDIDLLKEEISSIIKQNLPINTDVISYNDAIKLFKEAYQIQTYKQLFFNCPSKLTINTMDNFSDLYYGPLVPSSGYINLFDIKL